LNIITKSFLFFLISNIYSNAEQLTDSFRLDGYGNISTYSAQTKKNNDSLQFSGGLQGRYQITDRLSATGQVHFKEGFNSSEQASNSLNNYETELKWLYIDYYLIEDITLRVGAFQFPVFKSSETGDIGYSYTWTETPLGFYGVFGCDDFEGGEILKNFSYDDFDFLAQVSFGKSQNELSTGGGPALNGEVDNLVGLTLKTSHDTFILNIGYLQASTTLSSMGKMVQDPNVDFNMYAIESEIYLDDYTIKSGFIKTSLTNVFAEDFNYYTSLEYNYNNFTPYFLYSKETFNFKENTTTQHIQKTQTKVRSIEKYSIGFRYDYTSHIAFKISYQHEIEGIKYYSNYDEERESFNTYTGTINVIF